MRLSGLESYLKRPTIRPRFQLRVDSRYLHPPYFCRDQKLENQPYFQSTILEDWEILWLTTLFLPQPMLKMLL